MNRAFLFLLFCISAVAAPQWSPKQLSGLQLWLDPLSGCKRSGALTNSGVIDTWLDLSGNGRHVTNSTALPFYQPAAASFLNYLRFYGTNYLIVSSNGLPFLRTETNWTVCFVARVYDPYSTNSAFFDVTEQTSTQSLLSRNIFVSPASSSFNMQAVSRGEDSVQNVAQVSEDFQPFRVITSTRSGNALTLRINGTPVSTNSANTIGAMDAGSFYGTVGAVHNGSGLASLLAGDVMFLAAYNVTLSSAQITTLERWAESRFNCPLVYPTRYTTNPVVALGTSPALDTGRLLEASVLNNGSQYMMWYSAMTNGAVGNTNSGWKTFLATSSDGLTWAKSGMVYSNMWEGDVVWVASSNLFYMAHVSDLAFAIRLSTSPDGTNWTDYGQILYTNNTKWSASGPREPCLYWETGTFYLYFSDQETNSLIYKVGMATCSSGPTSSANWVCQTTPLFAATARAPGWNSGGPGDCESPNVRYYPGMLHPYVMTFNGYNATGGTNKKRWRNAVAWADSPSGPFTETANNPWLGIGTLGGWDAQITAETTHLLIGSTVYAYYAGGVALGTNQIGLVTMSLFDWKRLAR